MNRNTEFAEGFTQIPNKVITEIFVKGQLNETEMRITFYIIRWSWGFHKDWTNKTTVKKIAEDTGISRRLCSTTINRMIRENKLLRNTGRFKFYDEHQYWKKVSRNPNNKHTQSLTKSVNKKEQLVLTNQSTVQPDSNGKIITLKSPKESIKERINKTGRNIKEGKIAFNKQIFKFKNISEEKLEKWKEAFPSVNVSVELKKMEAWLIANPYRHKKNYERFIVNWLGRAKGEKTNGRYIPISKPACRANSAGRKENTNGGEAEGTTRSYAAGKW